MPENLHLIFVELFGFGFLFVSLQEIVVVIIVAVVGVVVVVVVIVVDQLFREDSDANFKLQSHPLRIITVQGIGGSWKFVAEKKLRAVYAVFRVRKLIISYPYKVSFSN